MCCFCILAGLEEEVPLSPSSLSRNPAEATLLFPVFFWCQKGWGQSMERATGKEGLASQDDAGSSAREAMSCHHCLTQGCLGDSPALSL